MLSMLLPAVVLASGHYTVEGASEQRAAIEGTSIVQCHVLEGGVRVRFTGPAAFKVTVRLDAPASAKRLPAARLMLELDGKSRAHKLTPRKGGGRYEGLTHIVPSRPLKPIALAAGKGEHVLTVRLEGRRSGCVTFEGLTPAGVHGEVQQTAAAPAEPPAAEPTLTPPSPPPPEQRAEVSAASVPAQSMPLVEEVRAAPAVELPLEAPPAAVAETRNEAHGVARLGVGFGGLMPAGPLRTTVALGVLGELPVTQVSSLHVAVRAEVGWTPLRAQSEVLVPGRGRTMLVQNALLLPMALGGSAHFAPAAWPVQLDAGLGLAVDYSRTELSVFSLPAVREIDWAFGLAAHAGLGVALGPGALRVEARYRLGNADLGALADVAEESLASGSLHAVYVVELFKPPL